MDVLHGPKKMEVLERTTADICVVTPEGVDWLTKNDLWKKLGADVLVIDESIYFRTHSSQRFRNIRTVLHTFKRRIILTATPKPKNYEKPVVASVHPRHGRRAGSLHHALPQPVFLRRRAGQDVQRLATDPRRREAHQREDQAAGAARGRQSITWTCRSCSAT
jgi:hypothetical protein